jgi:electron transfer flavoprotein beta subunit
MDRKLGKLSPRVKQSLTSGLGPCCRSAGRQRFSVQAIVDIGHSGSKLKIVVTVKQVPDPNAPAGLDDNQTIARAGELVLDPGDACGVELGLQLREAQEGEVVLLSMGPERARDAIRKGLSMGADRAILISDEQLAGADALMTARALAEAIRSETPDVVICGIESFDGSTGMVPPMTAELLKLPLLSFATSAQVRNDVVSIHRQTEEGYQVVEAAMPCLVAVTAAVAAPRYASLKGIMGARSKEIRVVTLDDLGVEPVTRGEQVEAIVDAPARAGGEVVEDDGSLGVVKILGLLQSAGVVR